MLNTIYTIYDKIAEEAGPLFTAKNDAIALRNVEKMFQNERIPTKIVESLILKRVGVINTETCHIEKDLKEISLKEILEFMETNENQNVFQKENQSKELDKPERTNG